MCKLPCPMRGSHQRASTLKRYRSIVRTDAAPAADTGTVHTTLPCEGCLQNRTGVSGCNPQRCVYLQLASSHPSARPPCSLVTPYMRSLRPRHVTTVQDAGAATWLAQNKKNFFSQLEHVYRSFLTTCIPAATSPAPTMSGLRCLIPSLITWVAPCR